MRQTQSKRSSDFGFPLATVMFFPLIIVGAWLILGDRLPIEALTVMIGVGAMGLVWAIASIDFGRREEARAAMRVVVAQEPMLAPLLEVPALGEPRMVTIIGGVGICPRGLKVADRLDIDADGKLSAPLCRTAVEALSSLMKDDVGAEGTDRPDCDQSVIVVSLRLATSASLAIKPNAAQELVSRTASKIRNARGLSPPIRCQLPTP